MRNGILLGKLYYLCDTGILFLSLWYIIKRECYVILMVEIKEFGKDKVYYCLLVNSE